MVDETNKTPKQGSFFVVGGLVFTEAQALVVDAALEKIRGDLGYRAGDSLKFDTNTRPAQVTIDNAQLAKKRVIEAVRASGVRMIVYLILHDLCEAQSYDVKMNYALNTLVAAYRKMLHEEAGNGMMLIDRDNERFDHLEYLFQHGLTISGRQVGVRDVVKLFGMSNDNASHLSSATDVALGAFRYCVNAAGGAGKDSVARAILPDLVDILWARDLGNGKGRRAGGLGFHLRPREVRSSTYRARYKALVDGLGGFLVDVANTNDVAADVP